MRESHCYVRAYRPQGPHCGSFSSFSPYCLFNKWLCMAFSAIIATLEKVHPSHWFGHWNLIHSLGKGIKLNWKARSALEALQRPSWFSSLVYSLSAYFKKKPKKKPWHHQGDIHFRAGMGLRVISILQMKKLRTWTVARTIFTQQDLNPNCLLVSGVDEGSWRKEHVLWATPENGHDVMPWVVIHKLQGCHGAGHRCVSLAYIYRCVCWCRLCARVCKRGLVSFIS